MDALETPWGEIPLFGPMAGEEERQLLLKTGALNLLPGAHVLVIGLGSGAVPVSLGLRKLRVTAVTDSAREQRHTLQSWMALGLPESHLVLGDVLSFAPSEFQAAVMSRPASVLQWDYALSLARRFLPAGFPLIAAPPQPEGFYEWKKWMGVNESLAPEALVFQGTVPEGAILPWTARHIDFPPLRAQLVLHPAVPFEVPSEQAAALLRAFPKPAPRAKIAVRGEDIILIGIAAAKTNKDAKIWCVTDSFAGIWSARESFQASGVGHQGGFLVADTLEDFDRQSVDLVLWLTKGDLNAESARETLGILKPGGELWLAASSGGGEEALLAASGFSVRKAGGGNGWAVYRALVDSV